MFKSVCVSGKGGISITLISGAAGLQTPRSHSGGQLQRVTRTREQGHKSSLALHVIPFLPFLPLSPPRPSFLLKPSARDLGNATAGNIAAFLNRLWSGLTSAKGPSCVRGNGCDDWTSNSLSSKIRGISEKAEPLLISPTGPDI